MMNIKKKEIASEIFTGSMADISFLLIIYFMITSAFSATRGLDFALPEETDTPEIKQEDSIEVHVLPGGSIEVDKKGLPVEGLLPYVLEKLQQNPDKPVILRTDPDATYGDMISVFDRLRRANEEWTDPVEGSEERIPKYKDVNGNPVTEIKTISIPTQREIENIWNLLGMG
jgi:biopolymer transport protein ExbD